MDHEPSNPEPSDLATAEIAHLQASDGAWDDHLGPFFEMWLRTFIYESRLDPQLRELAILRVLWRCARRFEWGNHYRFARVTGASQETVASIKTAEPARDLEGPLAIVVQAADDVVDQGFVTPDTVERVKTVFPDPQHLQEFLFVVAGYRMFASVSQSGPEEPLGKWKAWPPDGVAP
jgi:alkylhydroperoxidase family enzyme